MRIMLVLFGCALCASACSDSTTGPDVELTELPPLESIPLQVLGQGKLVFERLAAEPNHYSGVYIIDVASGESWGFGGSPHNAPAVDPSGQQLLYTNVTTDRPFYDHDVYVSDLRGRNQRRLTNYEGLEQSPSWTPDGTQFVFYVWENTLGQSLYQQGLSSREAVRIHSFTTSECPNIEGPISVAPGGELVFAASFCADVAPPGIYVLSGDAMRPVITSPWSTSEGGVQVQAPAWSPDGSHIAFVETIRDSTTLELIRTRIKLMDASGNSVVTLASLESSSSLEWAGSNNVSLCWSPDGSMVAFNNHEGELTSHLYVVGRDGMGLQRVTSAPGVTDRSVSWSR